MESREPSKLMLTPPSIIKMNSIWLELNAADRRKVMHDLAQRLESAESDVRLTAARILLYILQVAFVSTS